MLKYYDEIMRYTQRLTGDKNLAQDLTQEVYTKALEASKKSDAVMQKAFFYKIARNLVIDKKRKDAIATQIPYEEEEHYATALPKIEEAIEEERRRERLKACIRALPSQNRKAFVLHYYKGYTRKEIAQIMGISVNGVEKNITRAVLRLKEEMKEDDL
ncbi:MAG: RNA polymerase sigma factor [Wolinella succinogenes]|uniref:RNA polymerase sigma factor n=1 Tax=Wolinella succinogenes TaxID=844 RepID=UPI0016BB92F3|nr:RNA polymerase sigma factor [Wolinella succinogenes]NLU33362.1 RNA polymerase sigma factor [Wolinella succinogenes]